MKNIKYINSIKVFTSIAFVLLLFSSCTDYLDVNTDTDNPTVAPLNQLLTNIQLGVSTTTDFNNLSGDFVSVYTHQFSARGQADQYGVTAASIILQNEWNNTYLTITDIESLISQATESGDLVYVGIGELLKAYIMSVAVDLWGDVPYTEATLLEGGIVSPVFDDQEAIYLSVFDLIESSKINLNNTSGLNVPSTDDLFYGGDTSKWIKFANTFKLKLYNQIRQSSLFDQAGFNTLIAENNFFTSSADDFQFNHTGVQSPRDERNSLFLGAYGGTQVSYYLSPWFYEILKGWNPNIHNANPDPRIPYYIVNQLTAGEFPPDQGDVNTGNPKADYWDSNTGFFSIRFGSIGPDRDHAVQNSASFPGIFPCGGFYDDGSGPTISISTGTGVAPHRILTYDEFLYIQAELNHVGLLSGNAGTKLTEAMVASFAKVDEVVAGTGTTQSVPVLSGSGAVNTFIENVNSEFSSASSEKQLEIIMTQKWVATFGDSFDQYNDYRRTGYPVLADPSGPSPEYQLNNNDGFPLLDSQTVLNSPYQISFFWPQREINLNQNAPAQKNPTTYSIFWDN
jgi:hypothetical protein